ncbi:MAG: hypothetical protein DRJ35_04545 [Thermoprotei archaeon]|nr:MAG: hypothetical protein DRJ35_04545 [Thermoprotei archaeon]
MSDEIPWDRVARKLLETLGVETGRALFYAFIINTVYPQLYELITDLVEKQKKGEISREDAVSILEKELQKMKTEVELTGEPERDLALTLKKTAETQTASPRLVRLKNLIKDLETYEEIKRELIKKKYMTSDPDERKKIEEDLQEVEKKISELRLAIERLSSPLLAP